MSTTTEPKVGETHEQAASALAATRKRLEDAEKRLAEIAGETP